MCGVVAIVSASRIETAQLERGLRAIHHRGPDGQGIHLNQSGTAGLGHVRLAIMDPTGGKQPLLNEDGSLVLVANGEFYDFERIRQALETKGHHFKTKSDSEIALHLYEEKGLSSLADLRGEFAFILFDQNTQDVLAVRDRFGIKPLFYATYGNQLLIASEIKALFAAGVPAEWDESNLFQSLHFAGLESATLFKHVKQIPPGHYLRVKKHRLSIERYWDADYPAKKDLFLKSEAHAIDEVTAKLEEAVRIRTRSDVPFGCYLSGGVDSSTVLGMANRLSGKTIPAFSIVFDHADFDESKLAETQARFAGSEFNAIRVTNQNFADVFSEAVAMSEAPMYNGHAPARYILSREVKRAGLKVVLGGEGADELFAGYHFAEKALRGSVTDHSQRTLTFIFTLLSRLVKSPDAELRRMKTLSPTLFWAARVLGFPPELASHLLNEYDHLANLLSPAFREKHKDTDPFRPFLRQFPVRENLSRAPFHVVLYLWMKSHFPQYVLAAERLDMAFAVELRLPFLDHELFQVTKKLPASFLYKNQKNKFVLREIAKRDVCPEVLSTLKKPFIGPPSTLGNGNPLFDFFGDLLSAKSFREIEFLDHEAIGKVLAKFRSLPPEQQAPYDPLFYYLASLAVLKEKYKVT